MFDEMLVVVVVGNFVGAACAVVDAGVVFAVAVVAVVIVVTVVAAVVYVVCVVLVDLKLEQLHHL